MEWRKPFYILSIFGAGKGITHPALTFKSEHVHAAIEVNELLVALWQTNLKKIEESQKKLSSAQEEETARKLLQELDEDPRGPGG